MSLYQSKQIANNAPVPSADGYEPIAIVGDFVVPAGLVANDVVELCPIPAGYVPLNYHLACDQTDSNGAPTMTLDIGVISGSYGVKDNTRTCGNEGAAASTIAQPAAGGVQAATKKNFFQIAPTTADRGFGVKVAAGAATLVAGATWRLTLHVRPQIDGV